MKVGQPRRLRVRTKLALVATSALVVSLVPATPAFAEPQIRLLNPSNYSTTANDGDSVRVSDQPDADGNYHFVSWVKDVPPEPQVDFLIHSVDGPQTGNTYTIEAPSVDRVSADTWEAEVPLPPAGTFPTGDYTLTSRLYSNAKEVAKTSRLITINRASAAAEITYPRNGGPLGYNVEKTGFKSFLVEAIVSDAATPGYVRYYYSKSQPGSLPVWKNCGNVATADTVGPAAVRNRCRLATGDEPADVHAVAVVTNITPGAGVIPAPVPVDEGSDRSGDAHRVFLYRQQPTTATPQTLSTTAATSSCLQLFVEIRDQRGRAIAGTDVDVHATGPHDELRFGTTNSTTASQAPNRNHLEKENTLNCTNNTTITDGQGDHNVPGAPDPKHIEATNGTNDAGRFNFALRADVAGGTVVEMFADVNDDDIQQPAEPSAGTMIGWGNAPPPAPAEQLFVDPGSSSARRGSCQRFQAISKLGGNPNPSKNVDVHIVGPNADVSFCDPGDAGARTHPDSGAHGSAGEHADGTKHTEGFTDELGRFVFGVRSTGAGTTTIFAWQDDTNDDVLATDGSEESDSASARWEQALAGARSISIRKSASRVRRGGRVRIYGAIQGERRCERRKTVLLTARRRGATRFRIIATDRTSVEGAYSMRVRVTRTKEYRSVVRRDDSCLRARSRIITVRAR